MKTVKESDGTEMIAKCKEKSCMAAAMNGHLAVFPQCEVEFENGRAHFYRDGVEVWACNEEYARANFLIEGG